MGTETDMHRGRHTKRSPDEDEAETGVKFLQAKELWGLLRTTRSQEEARQCYP